MVLWLLHNGVFPFTLFLKWKSPLQNLAHMNGHWKAYDSMTFWYKLFTVRKKSVTVFRIIDYIQYRVHAHPSTHADDLFYDKLLKICSHERSLKGLLFIPFPHKRFPFSSHDQDYFFFDCDFYLGIHTLISFDWLFLFYIGKIYLFDMLYHMQTICVQWHTITKKVLSTWSSLRRPPQRPCIRHRRNRSSRSYIPCPEIWRSCEPAHHKNPTTYIYKHDRTGMYYRAMTAKVCDTRT